MSILYAKAYAKVNLSLDVVGRRDDGYHELAGVMQQISLHDDLWAQPADEISIRCNFPYVPVDERNILWKAAEAYFRYTGLSGRGVSFRLHKRVPTGAGLGGGSGDGAAAVKLLDRMYGTRLTKAQMAELMAPVGADLPFFAYGGTARAEGIGEKLTPLTPLKSGAMVLLKPRFSLPTPEIFGIMDRMEHYEHPSCAAMVSAVERGDLSAVADAMGNSMQGAVAARYPEITDFCNELKAAGAMNAIMSGSGSTVFGLFENMQSAKKAALSLIRSDRFCYVVTPKE